VVGGGGGGGGWLLEALEVEAVGNALARDHPRAPFGFWVWVPVSR